MSIKPIAIVSNTAQTPVLVSLVTPVFNEQDSIASFLRALDEVFSTLGKSISYEVVFVNDGSRDKTERVIESYMDGPVTIQLVNFSRNFGKEAALAAGLNHAKGDVVIPIDVDLQDPPELIPEMIKCWRQGARIINARRVDRSKDGWLKRITSGGFYKIFNMLADRPIPSDVGDFRLLDREVVNVICEMNERERFNKGIFSWVGFEEAEVTYQRPARNEGETSWSYWKLWKLALDGIFSSTTKPLRIWTYFGIMMSLCAFGYASFVFFSTILGGSNVPGYASTFIAILTFGGLNMIALGIIGEYIGRIYTEVRQRPLYVVRSIKESP